MIYLRINMLYVAKYAVEVQFAVGNERIECVVHVVFIFDIMRNAVNQLVSGIFKKGCKSKYL